MGTRDPRVDACIAKSKDTSWRLPLALLLSVY